MSVERVHHLLGKVLWRTLLILVVLLAVYVSGTRLLISGLPAYREVILDAVNRQLGSNLALSEIGGDLEGFTPALTFRDLQVTPTPGVEIRFSKARASLDPWASMLAISPRLGALLIDGAEVLIDLDLLSVSTSGSAAIGAIGPFATFKDVVFRDASVTVVRAGAAEQRFDANLRLERGGSQLAFQAEAEGPSGIELAFSGSGVGQLIALENFIGTVYTRLRIPDLGAVSEMFNANGSGEFDLELWYDSTKAQRHLTFKSAVVDLWLKRLDDQVVTLDEASLRGLIRESGDGWRATINDLSASANLSKIIIDKVQIAGDADGAITAGISEIDASIAFTTLLETGVLPKRLQEVISTLSPSGVLQASTVTLGDPDNLLEAWSAQIEIQNASVRPYKKVPGLYGIDATIEANQDVARAWIDTENFALDLPLVYDGPIEIQHMEGWLEATWRENFLRLQNGVINADTDDHPAKVLFGMDIPLNQKYAEEVPVAMYLDVAFLEAPISVKDKYIPRKLPASLDQWLDSARLKGEVKTGIFVWRGPFKDFGKGGQSMQLAADIDSAAVQYEPAWPVAEKVDAQLVVDTTDVALWSSRAESSGLQISDLTLMTSRGAKKHQLLVKGNVAGSAQDVLGFLSRSPIYEKAGGLLDDLDSSGNVTGHLELSLRLDDLAQDVGVQLRTDLTEAVLHSTLLDVTLTNLSGGLDFDLQAGFIGRNLSASLFARPISIEIGAGASGRDGGDLLDARLIADLEAKDIKSWFDGKLTLFQQPALNEVFLGDSQIQVDLVVGDRAEVFVDTDLAGLEINLPAPLDKNASELTPLSLSFDLASSGNWEGFWDSRLTARVTRHTNKYGFLIDVSPRREPDFALINSQSVDSAGFVIVGSRPQLILDPWIDLYLAMTGDIEVGSPLSLPILDGLEFEVVTFREQSRGPVTLASGTRSDWWMLDFTMPDAEGSLVLPSNGDIPELVFDNLNYAKDFGASDAPAEEEFEATLDRESLAVPLEVDIPNETPPELSSPLNVTIANLRYGGEPLGALTFRLQSDEEGMLADGIRGSVAALVFQEGSQLRWGRRGEHIWGSGFSGGIDVANLADAFQYVGLEPAARSTAGEFDINLNWPGAPTAIGLRKLDGNIQISLEDGSFLPVSSRATGVVRLFSLLNLAGLLQRANVTQLFEPGVAFTLAQGELQFASAALVIPGFSIDGPGGRFSFASDIDLITEIIDGELIVTLPLVDNIPWVAALAGGLPLAAGAYLMSKVFEDQVKTLSSAVYDVSGSVSNPDVEFVRLFDASSAQSDEAESEAVDQASSSSRK